MFDNNYVSGTRGKGMEFANNTQIIVWKVSFQNLPK